MTAPSVPGYRIWAVLPPMLRRSRTELVEAAVRAQLREVVAS